MKTVIEMAREAGFTEGELAFMGDNFIRFAELVRADEREACAKVCDETYYQNIGPEFGEVRHGIAACAAAIRARSNT